MKKQLFILSALCLMLSSCENTAHHTTTGTDNANRNARNGHAAVPGEQAESEADRAITQKVRQALLEDDSLSTNAKNIKIITINGVITLRGPVNNDREKNEIGKKAKAISGVRNVDNQLEITREVNMNRLDNAMRSEGRSDVNR